VSVINKMLQELDKRHAAPADPALPPGLVKPVTAARRSREWFWRILAVQLVAAVAWVGWVAWQLQPRAPLATPSALQAAAAAGKPSPAPITPIQPAPPVPIAPAQPAPPAPEPAPAQEAVAAAAVEAPRSARKEQPRPEAAPLKPALPQPKPEPVPPQALARLGQDFPQAKILQAPPSRAAKLEKRDLGRPAAERAEAEFRRAAGLLNQARASEAEDGFAAALALDPSHENARQALVSLLLERNRVEDARRAMQEGLAINPANPVLAMGLARLLASRRDYPAALDALGGARDAAAGRADYHALAGTILQRLGRNREAVESYSRALKIAPANGTAWMGMAISLEALERRADAAESFRRAVGTGTLSAEVRDYAEQRARALQ